MLFVKMNADDIKTTLKKPYNLENAQEIIDLAEAISEGNKKIATALRKKLSKNYASGKGQRYMLIQIAKYYMAYQAGIKDENTVRHMKKTVERFDKLLQEMKAYPDNTVKMNQVLNDADKLWKIVKQFYTDIKEGGLPIIVFQTTNKIDKDMIIYSHLIMPKAKIK
jgi:enamine deaminase RidA (YjgF/YER057c/UK114 family)